MARKFKGREVLNAHRRILITVTEADVRKGTPLDPENCAMAQAIKRTFGLNSDVHRGVTYIVEGDKCRRYRTTGPVRDETMIFDRGGQFMPGPYRLEPFPAKALVKRAIKSAPKRSGSGPLSRRAIPGVRHIARTAKGDR